MSNPHTLLPDICPQRLSSHQLAAVQSDAVRRAERIRYLPLLFFCSPKVSLGVSLEGRSVDGAVGRSARGSDSPERVRAKAPEAVKDPARQGRENGGFGVPGAHSARPSAGAALPERGHRATIS